MLEGIGFKRDFLCWRGRDFDERYECRVAAIGDGFVKVEFESDWMEISAGIAREIAFYLSEALAIAAQTNVKTTTAAVREEELLTRKYRLSCGAWQFSAEGAVHVENASPEFLDGAIGAGILVAVRTIEEGGFELQFGWMGFSFSAQDACWLQEKLLEVSQQPPKQYPRAGLLEAAEKSVAGGWGLTSLSG